jgi:hypothetical protein
MIDIGPLMSVIERIEARMRYLDYRSCLPNEAENFDYLNGEWFGLKAAYEAILTSLGIDWKQRVIDSEGVTAPRTEAGELIPVPYTSVVRSGDTGRPPVQGEQIEGFGLPPCMVRAEATPGHFERGRWIPPGEIAGERIEAGAMIYRGDDGRIYPVPPARFIKIKAPSGDDIEYAGRILREWDNPHLKPRSNMTVLNAQGEELPKRDP